MNSDLIRFVDSISRDKNIDKESIFGDLEAAMISAARKAYNGALEVDVAIDRTTGEIRANVDGKPIDMKTLGRIAAQTAKQVMIQKIREDERCAIFDEYSERVGTVVTGTVIRYERGAIIINLGRGEGILPRSEQIPGDQHHPGERVRGMILNVREEQSQVRIVLTQTHPDYIRKLFELEVPEVGERIIEIRALAREAGYRTKVAVSSIDSKVDAVGACVGVRGSRIRNIVDELGGEKIDIVRWNESSQVLITNALKPAEVREVFLCFELGRATVIVDEDQLSLAIGKRGQNVRLGAQLTGWDIDIQTPAEYDKAVDDMERSFKAIDGVEDVMLDRMLAMGLISVADVAEVGMDPLVKDLELEESLARRIVEVAEVDAKRLAAEAEVAKAAAAAARAEAARAEAAGETPAVDAEKASASDAEKVPTDGAEKVPVEDVSASDAEKVPTDGDEEVPVEDVSASDVGDESADSDESTDPAASTIEETPPTSAPGSVVVADDPVVDSEAVETSDPG